MHIPIATIAAYFAIGIEAGVCTDDNARDWAFAVIGAVDEPPGEIIDVSWRQPRMQLIAHLKAVPGVADRRLAGHWLLGRLYSSITAEERLWPLLRCAKHIVNAMDLGDELYYAIDMVEDNLEMAERGIWGTAPEAAEDFHALLKVFPLPPFKDGWSDIIFDVT